MLNWGLEDLLDFDVDGDVGSSFRARLVLLFALGFYMVEPLRRALDGVPACFPLEVMFFVIQVQLFRATDLQQSQRLKISDSKWTPI